MLSNPDYYKWKPDEKDKINHATNISAKSESSKLIHGVIPSNNGLPAKSFMIS